MNPHPESDDDGRDDDAEPLAERRVEVPGQMTTPSDPALTVARRHRAAVRSRQRVTYGLNDDEPPPA